ncbi:MAG: molybdopterin-dependent oxidoreductase [Chitinophagaceae bacterium]|nr:molybdopterin-dependent oxidoreductase [Chitinophagaceae bacterium]
MKKINEKHPLAIRWFHWINFPVLFVMIWTGMLIYWANDEYSVTVGSHQLIKFFPDWFYSFFNIPYRLSEGMAYHFIFMWLFMINGFLYILFTAISGEWKYLLPNRHSFKEAWQVLLHDLHIRRFIPPQKKYNAAQRIAYTAIIIMGLGSVLTGIAIYKPVQFNWLCSILGGYRAARIEHFILTIGYVLFFIVHIVQVIIAGWNNFRSVVTGFEIADVKTTAARPETEKTISRRTWISFSVFAAGGLVAWGGWKWLRTYSLEKEAASAGLPMPVRTIQNGNDKVAQSIFSDNRLVRTFPKSMAAKNVRKNGTVGLQSALDKDWKLNVERANGETFDVSLEEIKQLPHTEIVFDFKCIEGWDQISHWGGTRFSDFIAHYKLDQEAAMKYVSLVTPDEEYYIGIDTPSAMHPQTLLCYEVNGQQLPPEHGYPLRLITPVKYGVKNLKRIGYISFSEEKPDDYWAQRGYDYFSGL